MYFLCQKYTLLSTAVSPYFLVNVSKWLFLIVQVQFLCHPCPKQLL
uniref:Uncharacterized protein n=1 Tax=Anguilla anguilla TaxID=7936 RepID=A0A0E9VZJ7_ANGAN